MSDDDNVISIHKHKIKDSNIDDELDQVMKLLKRENIKELIVIGVRDEDIFMCASSFSSKLRMMGALAALHNFIWEKNTLEF